MPRDELEPFHAWARQLEALLDEMKPILKELRRHGGVEGKVIERVFWDHEMSASGGRAAAREVSEHIEAVRKFMTSPDGIVGAVDALRDVLDRLTREVEESVVGRHNRDTAKPVRHGR